MCFPRPTTVITLTACLAALLAGPAARAQPADHTPPTAAHTVRDRLWIFTVAAGQNNRQTPEFPAGNPVHFIDDYAPGGSRMTPAEGAFWLGVPNLLFINSNNIPPLPATEPGRKKTTFEQYAISFQPLDRVVWSVVGAGGKGGMEALGAVLPLAKQYPNICGVFLDDFVRPDKHPDGSKTYRPAMTRDELRQAREQIQTTGKPLELWVTLYTHEINSQRKPSKVPYKPCDPPLAGFLDQFDVLTLWTWNSDELGELEENLAALEKIAPQKARIALGLYLWDFHNKKPVPVDLMKRQCDLGLKWLKEGRISDMIFLANTVLDIGMPSAEFSREWIKKHGNEKCNR